MTVKSERLYIRINADLKQKLEQKAKEDNRTTSNYVLNLILKDLEGGGKVVNYTGRIYRDPEDGTLQLSYKGIENTDMYNITFEEFIEAVEASDTWDFIDSEVYESVLKDVGLDYKDYDDPDEMWDSFLEAVKNG